MRIPCSSLLVRLLKKTPFNLQRVSLPRQCIPYPKHLPFLQRSFPTIQRPRFPLSYTSRLNLDHQPLYLILQPPNLRHQLARLIRSNRSRYHRSRHSARPAQSLFCAKSVSDPQTNIGASCSNEPFSKARIRMVPARL